MKKYDGVGAEPWRSFLPSGETKADQKIMKRIAERFDKLGGTTPELSKNRDVTLPQPYRATFYIAVLHIRPELALKTGAEIGNSG